MVQVLPELYVLPETYLKDIRRNHRQLQKALDAWFSPCLIFDPSQMGQVQSYIAS
jgi:hypothetical protein